MVEKTINIMGGEYYFYLNLKDIKFEIEISNFIIEQTNRLVNIFNFFDKKSSLSILNSKKKIENVDELIFLINESLKFYELSKGRFNIFLGNQILSRKLNSEKNLNNINKKINLNKIISINKNRNKIEILDENYSIDLGGIAKGFIIDEVLNLTNKKYKKQIIDILIDARGDMVFFGKNKKTVEIENPFNENLGFEEFTIKSGSVITSGHNKQKFKFGSHILGEKNDILTITLKSNLKKCYELDAIGTFLIQLKSTEVLEKIEFKKIFEDIECILILNNGKVLKSSFW